MKSILIRTLDIYQLMSKELINRVTNRGFLKNTPSDHRYFECIFEENVGRVEDFRNYRKTHWQMRLQELTKRIHMTPPFQIENNEDLANLVQQ